MDETTLNDLLECSVCLERLDTTSKVLPCQHTFCKACLEVIVASHNELRCPECRVLVDIKIEYLPPNVLLMRILEGLKNSAAATTSAKATNEQTDKVEQNQQLSQQKSLPSPNAQQQQQQQLQRQPTVNIQRRCLLPHAYALYDFESSEPTDLHFKKGDLILLKHKIDTNWYVGQLKGAEGTFPSNYVQVMVPLPTPQAVALYDFKMQPNEEEGCLSFKKGAIVHVLRRVDQNWAEGRIGNAIGIFPIAFVELNALAKKLLQRSESKTPQMLTQNPNQQQLQQCSAAARNLPPIPLLDPTTNTASDTTTSPSSESPSPHSIATTTSPSASENQHAPIANTSSSSNLSTNSNSLPNTPQHYAHESGGGSVRYRNGREKRHSLNALLLNGSGGGGSNVTPGLSILQTNRHSAEILSIPSEELIVGSNEHQAAAAAMPQSSAAREQRQSGATATSSSSIQHGTTSRANVLKTACGPMNVPSTLPWGYLALYPYKPRKSDELELKKGCVYMVTERCLDGWFKGKNWQDISGVFPGNYVTPLRARDQQQLMHQWKFVPQQTMQQQQNPASNNSSAASSTSAAHATAATNLNQHKSTNLQDQQTKAFPKPPELPPRHAATTTTCASVWTKPLSHTVEAFFNRGGSSSTKNDDKSKEKETKTKESNSSGGAVSLMKRLTHIKSRAKSPGTTPARNAASSPTTITTAAAIATVENSTTTTAGKTAENALQATNNLQPVHIRSGSCPSQLLQNLPPNATNQQAHKPQTQQQQQQQHAANFINHGSERIKGHKERPRLQTTRQSMDGTLRGGIYANLNTAPTATMITNNFQLNPKCGQQFQMQQQQFMPTTHRKSHSLDANNMLSGGGVVTNASSMPAPPTTLQPQVSQLSMPNCNVTAAAVAQSATTKSAHCGRESRFRCIVPYPPNSDVELELHVGDIIYVQRKQKNGWYKGTHARTQKTGLFPASFVEPDF